MKMSFSSPDQSYKSTFHILLPFWLFWSLSLLDLETFPNELDTFQNEIEMGFQLLETFYEVLFVSNIKEGKR